MNSAHFAYRHKTPAPLHVFYKREEKLTYKYLLNTMRNYKIHYKFQMTVFKIFILTVNKTLRVFVKKKGLMMVQ